MDTKVLEYNRDYNSEATPEMMKPKPAHFPKHLANTDWSSGTTLTSKSTMKKLKYNYNSSIYVSRQKTKIQVRVLPSRNQGFLYRKSSA